MLAALLLCAYANDVVAADDKVAAPPANIVKHGGRIVESPRDVPGIGTLLYFLDTEGNRAGAMEYIIPIE